MCGCLYGVKELELVGCLWEKIKRLWIRSRASERGRERWLLEGCVRESMSLSEREREREREKERERERERESL